MYLKNIALGLDQFLNTILGGLPDETLSSRAYRTEQTGALLGSLFRPLIDCVLFFDKNHCKESYLSELNRSQNFPTIQSIQSITKENPK